MTKYYELDMENLKDAEFEITIGSKGDKYKGINMNNDWFYDILRFCNYVDTLYEIGSWKDEYKMLKYHLEDIIEGEEKYSSNEIANEYILKKSCYLLDIINRDGSKEDIQNYICGMKWEWSDIVIIYNLVKFEKGAKMNKEQIETIKRGIRCLMIIADGNGDFERKMLNEFMELYDNMKEDEYKYLYVKAIQVDKMLALGLNAKEMLENDLKSWEKWERESA